MPAAQITLDQDVINKLEEFLPEFREGGKKKRRSIVSRLSGETLPQGSDEAKHRKVTSHKSSFDIMTLIFCIFIRW